MRKRIVLFVEGPGDERAAPCLVRKLLASKIAQASIDIDKHCFKVGGVQKLVRDHAKEWRRYLLAARKRKGCEGILLLLDGDAKPIRWSPEDPSREFCAADIARRLAREAAQEGAGIRFSVAVVFARREYESWFICGIDSLRGKPLPGGRSGVRADAEAYDGDTDEHPREAKGWIARQMPHGYKPTTDQEALTRLLDIDQVRVRSRSFRRLEHAAHELLEALQSGQHVASPAV
jgi:hypothetical protein